MISIIGLGNPGNEYSKTRHNTGFLFLETLTNYIQNKNPEKNISQWKEEKLFQSEILSVKEGSKLEMILVKPLTYMNNSGTAVKKIVEKFNPDQIILVHDDLDIQLGKYKIQKEKSPQGHKGVMDIENKLKTKEFLRVRVGIDNRTSEEKIPGESYVLMKFTNEELEKIQETVSSAIEELMVTLEYK